MKRKSAKSPNGFAMETMHGSARFAELQEVQSGGLCSDTGMYYGLYSERGPSLISAQPLNTLVVAANADERREQSIIERVMTCSHSLYVADCSGKIAPVVVASQFQLEKRAYCFTDSPGRLSGPPWFIPSAAVNVLSQLTPGHPKLFQRLERILSCLQSDDVTIVESRDRDIVPAALKWLSRIAHWHIQTRNRITSLPELGQLVDRIISHPRGWHQILTSRVATSPIALHKLLAQEMSNEQQRRPERYLKILAAIQSMLAFTAEPALARNLSVGGLSVQRLLDSNVTFFNLSKHAALQKMFTLAMIYAVVDKNLAAPVHFIFDERARLGNFEIAPGQYSEEQTDTITMEEHWDCISQIKSIVGEAGLNHRIDTFPLQQFFSVGTYTASFLSRRLGTATVRHKSSRAKMQDDQYNADIAIAVHNDEDPTANIIRAEAQKDTFDYFGRPLRKPEEIEHMPGNQQIICVKGFDFFSIAALRRSYQSNSRLRGLYLPSPSERYTNEVNVRSARNRIYTVPLKISVVPQELRHLPQFATGYWARWNPSSILTRSGIGGQWFAKIQSVKRRLLCK